MNVLLAYDGSADAGAQPRAVRRGVSVWGTILDGAADADADVVVVGSRGLTGIKSLLLGSVSRGVLNHADRPVTVVPGVGVGCEGDPGGSHADCPRGPTPARR